MNANLAYLVTGLGCLFAVIGAVVAVIALTASRRRPRPPRPSGPVDPFRSVDDDADALRGDPRRIAPGDIVEIRGTSYGVRGTLRCTEDGWTWSEHLLDDAHGRKVWLSVEEDPDLKLALWTEVPGATVQPGAPTVDFDGRRYVREESGYAHYTAIGTTGLNPTGTLRYQDYAASDGALLSFESYGESGRWEVGRGERLQRAELMIYPRSQG